MVRGRLRHALISGTVLKNMIESRTSPQTFRRWVLAIAALAIGLVVWMFLRPHPVTGNPTIVSPLSFNQAVSTTELILSTTPIDGPFAAKVTIVEFLDYQCPGCGAYYPVLKQMRDEFKGKIRFAVRQFPLAEIHPYAKGAAISAVCAQHQNKFFEYSDILFQNQQYLRRLDLERYAEEMGLDMQAFKTCLDDPAVAMQVVQDRQQGEALGIRATPTVYLNGTMMKDLVPPDELRKIIVGQLTQ